MSSTRLCLTLFIISVSLALSGCSGGDGGGSASSGGGRSRFGLKKKNATASTDGRRSKTSSRSNKATQPVSTKFEDMSPESSMQRDLASLKDQERTQAKAVGEMRDVLAKREQQVRREEDKLDELRGKIDSYSVAMTRYDDGGRGTGRSSRDEGNVVPANMYSDPRANNRNAQANYRQEETLFDRYGRNEQPRNAPAPDNRSAAYRSDRDAGYGREEMVWDGRSQPQPSRYEDPRNSRGVPPAQQSRPVPQQQQRAEDDWQAPMGMYSNNPRAPQVQPRQQPQQQQPQAQAPRPAPQPQQQQAQAPRQTSLRPAPMPASSPSLGVTSGAVDSADDEGFSPDLYLGVR